MMIKVIYFNQWFSSITDVIKDIKERHPNDIKIVASSKNPDHAYKDVVDTFIVEDWVETENEDESMKNYTEWLLKTCKDYKVDLFFVKKYAIAVTARAFDFSMNGTFLISEDIETLRAMESKANVYDILARNEKLKQIIPDYYNGNNYNDIKNIIKAASNKENTPWCFKLDNDEGGASFRAIEQKKLDFESLKRFRVNSVSSDDAYNMLQDASREELSRLLFMERLDSPEISVDCYNSKNGFIAICREKVSVSRAQRIFYDKYISNICNTIGNELKLRFPFNVQFRIKHDGNQDNLTDLRLLEINPRMSGGTYYSTLFGMNIANVCMCDMLHKTEEYNIKDFIDFEDKRVSHVEQAIKIN